MENPIKETAAEQTGVSASLVPRRSRETEPLRRATMLGTGEIISLTRPKIRGILFVGKSCCDERIA